MFSFNRAALPAIVLVTIGTVAFLIFSEPSHAAIFFAGGLFGSLRYKDG